MQDAGMGKQPATTTTRWQLHKHEREWAGVSRRFWFNMSEEAFGGTRSPGAGAVHNFSDAHRILSG